jgi:hypothetical protein
MTCWPTGKCWQRLVAAFHHMLVRVAVDACKRTTDMLSTKRPLCWQGPATRPRQRCCKIAPCCTTSACAAQADPRSLIVPAPTDTHFSEVPYSYHMSWVVQQYKFMAQPGGQPPCPEPVSTAAQGVWLLPEQCHAECAKLEIVMLLAAGTTCYQPTVAEVSEHSRRAGLPTCNAHVVKGYWALTTTTNTPAEVMATAGERPSFEGWL